MNLDIRRSKRATDFLPIAVTAQNGLSGDILAGPFSGKVIDISNHGARLLMTQVMMKSFHLFHTTKDNDSAFLMITFNVPPDIIELSVPARPVWMSLLKHESIRAFKVGVEFLISPDGEQMEKLLTSLKKQQKRRQEANGELDLQQGLN